MDEIWFGQTVRQINKYVESAPESPIMETIGLMIQLISDLNERMLEMQVELPDDDNE